MGKPLRVLNVEDSEQDTALLTRHLKQAGYDLILDRVETANAMRAALASQEWDVILCDYSMPKFSALGAVRVVQETKLDIPLIIISGTVGEDVAVEAMRSGAHDYLMKGNLLRLGATIERELQESGNRRARRQAEESMEASELRYRRLFESAKDGILILDADSGKIVDINPYLIELLGFSKEDLAGKELWEIGAFKDIVASKFAFAELQQQGYIRYSDLPLQTRSGAVKQVEFVSNSYFADGSRVIQCNIRDNTEHQLAETVLRQTNQRLERALDELQDERQQLASMTQQLWQASKLATMGELSASIAHELNNPLATVSLRVENLLLPMTADDPQRHSLEIISQEVDRMASLVDNLLQFSRRSYRQISTVDVRQEIVNSIEFVHYHLQTHRIEVVREFAEPLFTIQADHQQLRQLFLNLLTNASDAMPSGGKLIVRAESTYLEGVEAVAIEFVDTGEGVSPDNLEKIWEPFFTTKQEGKGTGLGLAICRRIIEEHDGTIAIKSQVGTGTTVRMVFPATTNEALVNLQ
ncbi:MAG TPA: hypothetical protein DC047_02810 [Blastocatellia bacterium]|nr:hypothetical protein [Blastocatellia bacterium]